MTYGLDLLSQAERLNTKSYQVKQHRPPCLPPSPSMANADRLREANVRRNEEAYTRNLANLRKATAGRDTWTIYDVAPVMNLVPDAVRRFHDRLFAQRMLSSEKGKNRQLIWSWR